MKTSYFFIFIFCIGTLFQGCSDSFLERYPETNIAPNAYFKSTKDLELYTNTFYDFITPSFHDGVSDNVSVFADASEVLNLLRGNITPATVGGWNNWGELRSINFLLDNVENATGNPDEIKHYVGIARLMRAHWYYGMVKRYHEVPWYSSEIKDTDEDLLYKAKEPRHVVVDSVLADLEYAVENIKDDMGNKTRINKWFAYATMARICLHEGTFRKYHDEIGLQETAAAFLQKAEAAAAAIINSNLFSIDKSGGADKAYQNLFINYDLSKSPEIILFKDYDLDANIKHPASAQVFDFVSGLSRSLMESYDYIEDGEAKDFTSIPGYETKEFTDVFTDRDPRLAQTFMYPGYVKPGQANPYRPNLNFGGYPQIKFVPQSADQVLWATNYTDLPISRYAEVLLIFAEAKAELGTFTQNDLDITINEIRSRVEMPAIQLNNLTVTPSLAEQYPNVMASNSDAILTVRKERRIELACEGFRLDDLMRWKAGELLGQSQQGVYFPSYGLYDFSGDGTPDIGVFENEASNTVPENERDKYVFYYIGSSGNGSVYLSNGNSGYMMSSSDKDSRRTFKSPQYYYYPIPQSQLILNTQLEQTKFWEN